MPTDQSDGDSFSTEIPFPGDSVWCHLNTTLRATLICMQALCLPGFCFLFSFSDVLASLVLFILPSPRLLFLLTPSLMNLSSLL